MSSKAKGSAKSSKKGRFAKPGDKDKGHPQNHRKRQAGATPEPQEMNRAQQGKRSRQRKGSKAQSEGHSPKIVITVGHGHPRLEPDTYNAAELLNSVLAVVEQRLDEGLAAMADTVAQSAESPEAGDDAAAAVRAVGRQIAEALRAGVMEGMRTRERHLAQLAVIDRAAANADSLTRLQARITAEIEHAGLRRVSDLTDLSPFNLASGADPLSLGADADEKYELIAPAYVEADTGRVVERGWIKTAEIGSAPRGKHHGTVSRDHRNKRREEKPTNDAADVIEKSGRDTGQPSEGGGNSSAALETAESTHHRSPTSGAAANPEQFVAEVGLDPTGTVGARDGKEQGPSAPRRNAARAGDQARRRTS